MREHKIEFISGNSILHTNDPYSLTRVFYCGIPSDLVFYYIANCFIKGTYYFRLQAEESEKHIYVPLQFGNKIFLKEKT